jgi:hypothetical protein
MLVASALDALIHVRNERQGIGTSQQFIDRVRLLAGDLGLSLSEEDAKGLWDHRSDVVHGRDPWLSVRDPNDPQWQIPPIRKSDPNGSPLRRCGRDSEENHSQVPCRFGLRFSLRC